MSEHVLLFVILGAPRVGRFVHHFPLLSDVPFNGWIVIWAVGLLLALLAAVLDFRRWFFAAALPVITFFATIAIVTSGRTG